MSIIDHLTNLCDEGDQVNSSTGLNYWFSKVSSFLRTAIGPDAADEFLALQDEQEWTEYALRLGHLQGLVAKTEAQLVTNKTQIDLHKSPSLTIVDSRKVFVVHGHDEETKSKVARFLDKLGLKPIILHEQPNSGRTIIEKFETYSDDISFAVVLLTPDDVGGVASTSNELKSRARQNVVLELGYFIGRLGRSRVCALYKGNVELPSDYQGVLYIELDAPGAWQAKLAQEFVQAKLPIDLNGLLGS
jgi:predicted nucleotide-binding protein